MGTRSHIAIQNNDGTVRSIYCHWDGYPSHNGKILLEHYTDPVKINKLMDLGDISSLDADIGEKHDFNNCPKGVCNAYGRDRGEDNVDGIRFDDMTGFEASLKKACVDYAYLFKDNKWFYIRSFGTVGEWIVLSEESYKDE